MEVQRRLVPAVAASPAGQRPRRLIPLDILGLDDSTTEMPAGAQQLRTSPMGRRANTRHVFCGFSWSALAPEERTSSAFQKSHSRYSAGAVSGRCSQLVAARADFVQVQLDSAAGRRPSSQTRRTTGTARPPRRATSPTADTARSPRCPRGDLQRADWERSAGTSGHTVPAVPRSPRHRSSTVPASAIQDIHMRFQVMSRSLP